MFFIYWSPLIIDWNPNIMASHLQQMQKAEVNNMRSNVSHLSYVCLMPTFQWKKDCFCILQQQTTDPRPVWKIMAENHDHHI